MADWRTALKTCSRPAASRRYRRVLTALGLLVLPLWVIALPASGAGEAEALEHRIKAAFLYKFAGYVDWPETAFASPQAPITIAVMGAEPVLDELRDVVARRTAYGRPIAVRRLRAGEPLVGVHIVFVARAAIEELPRITQSAQAHSVLVVTDSEGALARGSVINFVIAERRVRFEIALDTAEQNGLGLSSRLLAVAHHVRRRAP